MTTKHGFVVTVGPFSVIAEPSVHLGPYAARRMLYFMLTVSPGGSTETDKKSDRNDRQHFQDRQLQAYTVSQKIPPPKFTDICSKMVGNF